MNFLTDNKRLLDKPDLNDEASGLVEPVVRCDDTRCPDCGYTKRDAEIHMDHHLCENKTPPWL